MSLIKDLKELTTHIFNSSHADFFPNKEYIIQYTLYLDTPIYQESVVDN